MKSSHDSPNLTRRELILASAAAGSSLSFLQNLWAQDSSELKRIAKPIPSSGERLPAIGLGTIWYRMAQYDQLKPVIERMNRLGGTVIDTAAAYDDSETVVGRSLAELGIRNKMFVATKFDSGERPSGPGVSMPLPGPPAGVTGMKRDGIAGRASFDRSLQRLQTDHVDLLQVHGMNGTETLMPLLIDLKKAKKIRYIGVTTSTEHQHAQLVEAMHKYPIDFVQVDFSLGDRSAALSVLPAARKRKIAVLANLPLGRATLLQKMTGKELPGWAADIDVKSWAQFLLKYVISQPAVTCAIPGSTKISHLEDNLMAGHGRLADAAMLQRMESFWDAQAA